MRKPRIIQNGAIYHITSMINRKENIFDEEEFKRVFLNVVKRAKKKYDFELRNFCVMHNHIHFLLKPLNDSNPSRIMQWILSVFAVLYNKSKKYTGHVWQSRFFSKIIDDIRQLVNTFRYICNNPVNAGFVVKACEYKFGGLYHIKMRLYDLISRPDLKRL